ncbi:NUDIX domain-containing protein [Streptomyces sp. SID3343]|nr:NUDIX domain-containing protein [Streptomyces sp. SID3343]
MRRDGPDGPRVPLSRRAGAVHASGLWHLPSGHLDGPHESVVDALVRETAEEPGVLVDPADVHATGTAHHRGPEGGGRVGFFFEVRHWRGTPRVMEPAVCDAMDWYRLDALPAPRVAYSRAGLDAYRAGARLAVHFRLPGDPIAYDSRATRMASRGSRTRRVRPKGNWSTTIRAATVWRGRTAFDQAVGVEQQCSVEFEADFLLGVPASGRHRERTIGCLILLRPHGAQRRQSPGHRRTPGQRCPVLPPGHPPSSEPAIFLQCRSYVITQ